MKKSKAIAPKLNYARGATYALGGPVAGIAAWAILWNWGFIASIATFLMAWLTVWLYRKGAGGIDRKALYAILPYIAVGLILSILSGMILDGLHFVLEDDTTAKAAGAWAIITNSAFWSFMTDNLLHNGELWKEYTTDILIAVALGGLGIYSTVKGVLLEQVVRK